MATKEELLEALDMIEKQLGAVLVEACAAHVAEKGVEPVQVLHARARYSEGSLWLRSWLEKIDA